MTRQARPYFLVYAIVSFFQSLLYKLGFSIHSRGVHEPLQAADFHVLWCNFYLVSNT
jgi:hypothetical protein